MSGEVVVDALPYIDQGYDEPGVREAVSFESKNILNNAGGNILGICYDRGRMSKVPPYEKLFRAYTTFERIFF